VAVVGWSYGGAVVSDLVDVSSVARLVFSGYIPEPSDTTSSEETLDLAAMPGLLTPDDRTVLLDND
jgi:hypothetical protein